jgi:predicted nicotinamide N-methyase
MLTSRHRHIRRLRRKHNPFLFGTRAWTAGWLLIDYLSRQEMPSGLRVMDVGCGWGHPGIYCSQRFKASVISVDVDPEVFPFLRLHCEINEVEAEFFNEYLEDLDHSHFEGVDLVIGSDICFYEKLIDPLKAMAAMALEAGVSRVILSDPGRPTFNRVGEFCEQELQGEQLYWRASCPRKIQGQIITVGG